MVILPPSLAALLSLNLGYLSGDDLVSWCEPQILIARQNIQPGCLQKAANQAVDEVASKLRNVYDLTTELLKSPALSAYATVKINAGAIEDAAIIDPGSGYKSAPTIAVTNLPSDITGSGATVTATVTDSVVSFIELLNSGGRYTSAPTVSITGGGGTGATASCTINGFGRVVSLVLLTGGTGYTSIPDITFSGGGGIGAAAVAVVTFGKVSGLTITGPGTLYTAAPLLVFSGGLADDTRSNQLVKIMSIFAVRNALGNMQNISDKTKVDFATADQSLADIKSGLDNLPFYSAVSALRSNVELIKDRFHQLG